MGKKITVASCTLNQWALDFDGNRDRIIESIRQAKKAGAKLRIGGELEVTGYDCADHFLESDTFLHSYQVLAQILIHPDCQDILIFIGMPVMHRNVGYNCIVVCLNKKILFIRPKKILCDDRNYRETRWFSAWTKTTEFHDYFLPRMLQEITGQTTVHFGDVVLSTYDTCVGIELCEELWAADSPHVAMGLDGVEIFCNSSGSHHELRKSQRRANSLILDAVRKSGGVYVFANLRGCGGDRIYYDGGALIAINGEVLSQGRQFSLADVEVTTATFDIEEVRSYRNQIRSRCRQATMADEYHREVVNFALSTAHDSLSVYLVENVTPFYHSVEEELALGPSCWLWDYLRRSNQNGFFLPLSGGRDSASVACMVYSMCRLVCESVKDDSRVLSDVRRIVGLKDYIPHKPEELCKRLLHTCYMGTKNSSAATKALAANIAAQIGCSHSEIIIDDAFDAVVSAYTKAVGDKWKPNFKAHGGTNRENLALQNLQARLRMVHAYFFAQLLPWSSNHSNTGSLLVLGTANVDESLRGYFTKYDCSSADINPIGSISKTDLNRFLNYCLLEYDLTSLKGILAAIPTAELEPLSADGQYVQSDEVDMGMTYEELSVYGRLRKPGACGPYSMFCKLAQGVWKDKFTPREIGEKVKHFFRSYAINRHKMTTLTPAYHAETYSPDDHRHDHRPFLYNVAWPWQFREIDKAIAEYEKGSVPASER